MQQIQLTEAQIQELQTMTRPVTPDDEATLNRAYAELDKKGFVFSGENLMVLLRGYNQAPQVPITVQNILQFTTKYRDAFEWLGAAEVEYNKLSAEIGPETSQLVIKELGRHGLVNTAGTEDLFTNFSAIVRYYQSQGWPITAHSFEKAVGNLRSSQGHGTLIYRQTPSEKAAAKRWESTRAETPKKSGLQIAKEKAATVAHIMNPDGTRMSDQIMREFYENHPEEIEAPKAPANLTPVDTDEAFYHKQTKDYIQSIASNLLRAEAEKEYGHQHNGSWKVTYHLLRNWYERRAPGAPQR